MKFNNQGYIALECACEEPPFNDQLGEAAAEPDEVIVTTSNKTREFIDELGIAVDMTERLEEIQDIARAAKEDTGYLSALGGKALGIATENAMNEMGMASAGIIPDPTMFATEDSSKNATEIAVEGLGEHIKDATNAIFRGVDKVKERLIKDNGKYLSYADKLEKRAKDLRTKIESSEFDKDKEIRINGFADRTGNEAAKKRDFEYFSKLYFTHEEFAKAMSRVYKDELIPLLEAAFYSHVKAKGKIVSYPEAPSGLRKISANEFLGNKGGLNNENADFYTSDKAPGGVILQGAFPKQRTGEEFREFLTKHKNEIGLDVDKISVKGAQHGKAYSKDEAAQLIDEILKQLSFIRNDLKNRLGYDVIRDAESSVSKLTQMTTNDWSSILDGFKGRKYVQAGRAFFYNYSSMLWNLMQFRSYWLQAMNSAMDGIDASIKK